MWLIIAFVLILFLSIMLVRYHLTIRSLTSQIRAKRRTGSQARLTLRDQAPSLVALTDEVEQLFQEIDKMSFVTQQEKKTLDMAISNIAHDIRTPLTIASGYTQQLLKDADKDQMDQQLQKIADNLSMVSRRLEALMEYRRLMEGAIRPSLQRVDLSQLVTQQLFAYYDAFQRAGINLDVDLSENLLLETDSDIFDRIIQNMLSNVLKHGRETASISLKKEGQKVIFQVKNKVQKPILHLDKLTNRFYSENLSSSEESSGLGLYITQQLVEILGGDLTIQAEDDWFELIVAL
ncbi:HAMP domain-containing histidine kinase [Streptococcus cristatus]|uniref:histidine kinase n=1 Tax=Streptococcus cristatus TaxID=45634 RepID=A0AAW5WM56_STRCR|nr:HAMP domain-containing sensor histidine kinase [Streptococcus cristatus]MCY7221300.1 HAMP domain-containing histidine kinase [Streptococcus cristatus]